MSDLCNCATHCGDDGDVDGPGVCKGLPLVAEPPLVEVVLVPRAVSGERGEDDGE